MVFAELGGPKSTVILPKKKNKEMIIGLLGELTILIFVIFKLLNNTANYQTQNLKMNFLKTWNVQQYT